MCIDNNIPTWFSVLDNHKEGKDCGKRGVLEPKHSYTPEQKEQILSAYTNERSSMRGLQRTFGVSRNTLTSWLKKRRAKPKA